MPKPDTPRLAEIMRAASEALHGIAKRIDTRIKAGEDPATVLEETRINVEQQAMVLDYELALLERQRQREGGTDAGGG